MTDLIRAELAKLRTTRTAWALTAVAVAVTLAMLALQLRNAGRAGAPSLGTTASMRAILGASGPGAFAVLILGVLSVTGEFRHQTITATLLVTPDRLRVIAAKLAAAAVAGLAVGALGILVTLAVAVPWLTAHGVGFDAVNPELVAVTFLVLLTAPLYAMLGVGAGALIRNQTVAVALCLLWFLVVEQLLPSYGLESLARWLPGDATRALTLDATVPDLLPAWAGGLLLLGDGLFLTAVGGRVIARRDIA